MDGQLLCPGRWQLASLEPIDGRQQERAVVRQLLARLCPATRVNNGGQVVGTQVLSNEPFRGIPDEQRA